MGKNFGASVSSMSEICTIFVLESLKIVGLWN
jgi:hypothetical protein